MAGMLPTQRAPESLTALIVEFAVAAVFTSLLWMLNVPIRGVRREDGPLSKSAIFVLVFLGLAIFLVLAAITAADRRNAGLPVF
jgi:hypothetical protein